MNPSDWLKIETADEFGGAELGDPRRGRRLRQIADKVSRNPEASFLHIFNDSAELEGFYRFIRNDNFVWEDVHAPHVRATLARCEMVGECLAIHDTTEFHFSGDREGCGPTSSTTEGYFAHVSLMVATDAARTPLGVLAIEQYSRPRQEGKKIKLYDPEAKKHGTEESRRWLRSAEHVEDLKKNNFECIHIADREGDDFRFMDGLLDKSARFVIRAHYNRVVEDEWGERVRLEDEIARMKASGSYDIEISTRGKRLNPSSERSHPSRSARTARVSIAARKVLITGTKNRRTTVPLELNLVRVWEEDVPKGEPRVDWLLWTTETVSSSDEMQKVVNYYRSRWMSEEYFKALKTGCQFEKRQLDSTGTLMVALAVFLPIAWKMLLCRSVAHRSPESPAENVINKLQQTFLQQHFDIAITTAIDALRAIARLGGHLKRNGEPGWQTLGKGWLDLLKGEAFFRTVQSAPDL